eukprot:Hpha_TRINITY_DN15048_c1_g2::TRINITY_DN15048_c1_g2_i1::g.125234::m.125234
MRVVPTSLHDAVLRDHTRMEDRAITRDDRASSGGSLSSSSDPSPPAARRVRFATEEVTSVRTFDPFAAGVDVGEEHLEAALRPGAVLVVPAAAYPQGFRIMHNEYVQYHFDLIIEGRRVATIAGRYSELRKRAEEAATCCQLLPNFPPRRWWRDTLCDWHIEQRVCELSAWLQMVVNGEGKKPCSCSVIAGSSIVEEQRYAAARKLLRLKRRSLVARLLTRAAYTRRMAAESGNGRLIEKHPASFSGGCESPATVDEAQSHSDGSDAECSSSTGEAPTPPPTTLVTSARSPENRIFLW